ncbi:MAG: hypothetical protein R3266_13595, partial [Gemmatimonadota bacterium]|nr:hypothetical protein [Gemmatimonadota bacterium]
TNGIPSDEPVRVVREDPDRAGLLYAGTEFGLYISFDGGESWQSFQLDLPVVPVTDIAVHRKHLALATMGRGFWVLDDIERLHAIDDGSGFASSRLFDPAPRYRVRPPRHSGFGWSGSALPEYPGTGANIDYWIAPGLAPDADVTLEILDAGGQVLRTYTGAGTTAEESEEAGMRRVARQRGGGRLMRSSGAHRMRWDLRAEGPGGGRGPMVPPGVYTLRLTAGDEVDTAPLELLIDPRVAAEGVTVAELEEQYRFNLAVLETQAAAREVAEGIDRLRERVEEARAGGAEGAAPTTIERDLDALEARLRDAGGSYPRPMLLNQIGYLLGMTSRADQAPGVDAYERHEELRSRVGQAVADLAVIGERVEALAGG